MAYADFRHRVPLRVRWAEVDLQGVVFNGHYLTYCDVCITEYWREAGMAYPTAFIEMGCDLFVRKAGLEYHAPAVYDDQLEACGRVARLGRTSLTFAIEIHRVPAGGEALLDAELVYVSTDLATKKAIPLPDRMRERVQAFERTPPLVSNGAR